MKSLDSTLNCPVSPALTFRFSFLLKLKLCQTFVMFGRRENTQNPKKQNSCLLPADPKLGLQQYIRNLSELRGTAAHQGDVQAAGLPGHRRGDGGAAEGGQEPGELHASGRREGKRPRRLVPFRRSSSQLCFVVAAPGHHHAVREDLDGGDAEDLQTPTPRVRFPR